MPSPPAYRAGDDLPPAAMEWAGVRVEIKLKQLGWQARSDQVAALIGGEWIITNRTAVARELVKMLPRVANKEVQAQWDR